MPLGIPQVQVYECPFRGCKNQRRETELSNPKEKFESKKLPMMPIRDVVIFPYMMTPFVVGRESSVRALEEALASDKKIFLATQHDASIDEPKAGDIFQVGTSSTTGQALKLPDANIKVLSKALSAARFSRSSKPKAICKPPCASPVMPPRPRPRWKPACSASPGSSSNM